MRSARFTFVGDVLEIPESVTESAPDPVPESVPAERPRRRRGRTTLLIASAAVLGAVAGGCTGYLIQADRNATALPPLSQPTLPQAKGPAPKPLSAARDRQVRMDGDLRELLLDKPRGAKDVDGLKGNDGWLPMYEYANYFDKPVRAFGALLDDEFRRAVTTGWEVGNSYTVEIQLAQFRQEEDMVVDHRVETSERWADNESDTDSWPVPGTENGMVYVHRTPEEKPGYLPLYGAEAYAWRGDTVMGVWVYSSKPIAKATIMDLAKRQMERL